MLSVCYSLGMCVWTLIAVLSECDSHTPRVLWGISGFRGDSSCVAVCNTRIWPNLGGEERRGEFLTFSLKVKICMHKTPISLLNAPPKKCCLGFCVLDLCSQLFGCMRTVRSDRLKWGDDWMNWGSVCHMNISASSRCTETLALKNITWLRYQRVSYVCE